MRLYRFILLSNSSGRRLELTKAPIGWDATKANVIRNLTYLGVLTSLSVELGFIGDGYEMLQQERLRYGMDADILLKIYLVKENQFLFVGKIDFAKYAEQRKTRTFKVDIIQSSFVQKFNNREDIELNVLNTLSMDRLPISPPILETATIRGKQIRFYSESNTTYQETPDIYHHIWPFKIAVNGNPGVKEVSNIYVSDWVADTLVIEDCANNPLTLAENALYENVLVETQTIDVAWEINFTAIYAGSVNLDLDDNEINYLVFRLLKVNSDNTVDQQLFYRAIQVRNGSLAPLTYSYTDTLTFTTGQYLIWHVERWGRALPFGFIAPLSTTEMDTSLRTEVTYNSMLLTIEQVSVISDTQHNVMLPFELFASLIAQVNGGSLLSYVFGRTDLGYAEDGDGAYIGTVLGTWLRNIPVEDTQYKTSLRTAFKSYSSILCLGAHITKNQVQIDTLDRMFNYNVNVDLDEVEDLQIEPTDEFLFNSIQTGYPNNEYEQENGRDEFNTTYQYTNSFQSVKKELKIASLFCGDGYGIEFARRQSVVTTGTQDSRYDDKIFFIDLIKDGADLISRRQEDILLVEGIFSPETVINARIAVGQNMLRWRKYLNIPLHNKPDKVCYFQSKDKNSGFRVVTVLGDTTDGEDVNLGSSAYFLNEGKRFKRPISLILLGQLLANPLGLTKYTYENETFYDLLMEVNSEIDKHSTQWRMLGTRSTPPDIATIPYGNYIKYGDGLEDFIKYDDGAEDFIKYAD